ncbi:hypothetical protein EUGRSUZ_E00183 [Eucalyptus grandis]|uniref:Methenyltetrahydrofolate cyclohydrolase n=2 Tax=Eucalyptus grandis TaxID=71139 RepID=A0A059BZW0_EUCGR|nr:hypothetical protein EUGRSUZ_E00183 [Eucalyptus grandis]
MTSMVFSECSTSAASRLFPRACEASVAIEACAKVIDGKHVAKQIRDEISAEVSRSKEATGVVPGLAVILVGDRKDSATYVRNKKRAYSKEEDVLKFISRFNDDPSAHGILVQLPLPSRALFVPCTPKGCIELLHRYGIGIKGKRAVVIGRSNIVGMPAALLLHYTSIFIVHSRTQNTEEIAREADIIIAAVGQANMVRGTWIKPGAVIIDVGIKPVEIDPKSSRGYKLVGDVCYEEACKVASAITPVPGGVGPMKIAKLLSNTLTSAKWAHNFQRV